MGWNLCYHGPMLSNGTPVCIPGVSLSPLGDAELVAAFPQLAQFGHGLLRPGDAGAMPSVAQGRPVWAQCPHCGWKTSARGLMQPDDRLPCGDCGHMLGADGLLPLVLADGTSDTAAAVDPARVTDLPWFHVTTHPRWPVDALGADGPNHVHVGSEMAALDRAHCLLTHGVTSLHFYRVSVLPRTGGNPRWNGVSHRLFQDGRVDYIPQGNHGVERYLNRFEDPGSISLAVRPHLVHAVAQVSLDLGQLG